MFSAKPKSPSNSKYSLRDNKQRRLRKNRPDSDSESDDSENLDDDDEYETVCETSDSSYNPPKSSKHHKRKIVLCSS